MKLSIIIPVFNEEQSLPELFEKIQSVMHGNGYEYEIIAIDDGSKDASFAVLSGLAQRDTHIKVLSFHRNEGQTAAICAGMDHAKGDFIIPIDSDLENDPADIPVLLAKINDGFDVVSGWRKSRWHGAYLTRKLPSTLANYLISSITGTRLHDYGCTLKVYRREVIQGFPLYGEMHRFIPAYASLRGARVSEVSVTYTPRKFGHSNYGISRTFHVLLDLLMIRFFESFKDRPIHFFGAFGFIFLFFGSFAFVFAIVLRIFGIHLVQTPLPVFSALFLIMGLNFVLIGVLAEMMVRHRYLDEKHRPYTIRDRINVK